MTAFIIALSDLLQRVPQQWRERIYDWAGAIAAVLTVVLLGGPVVEDLFAIALPDRPVAILTGVLALLSALARANVVPAPPSFPPADEVDVDDQR